MLRWSFSVALCYEKPLGKVVVEGATTFVFMKKLENISELSNSTSCFSSCISFPSIFFLITVTILNIWTYSSEQKVQTQIRLFWAYTVCHAFGIFQTPYCIEKRQLFHFRMVIAIVHVSQFLVFFQYSVLCLLYTFHRLAFGTSLIPL